MSTSRGFEAFFDLAFPQAETVARRITGNPAVAEDLAAEALARAYASWSRVQRHPSPEAWVLRTTINLATDRARRRGRAEQHQHELSERANVDSIAEQDQVAVRLALGEALNRLPKRQREVVALRYLAEMSEAEVANALNVSAGSVKTHLHRAMKKLKVDLDPLRPGTAEPKEPNHVRVV